MATDDRPAPRADLASALTVRRIGVDDFADVRYIHTTALRAFASDVLTDEEIGSLAARIQDPEFITDLLRGEFYGAWLTGRLVATAAFLPVSDGTRTTRIEALAVDPLYARAGIGSHMLADMERRATEAGATRLTVRTTANAVPFYERQGYGVAAQGMHHLGGILASIPVTFLAKAVGQTSAQADAQGMPPPVIKRARP